MTFVNDDESLEWLRKVHNVPQQTRSAMIHGNEDSPDRIECWFVSNPRYDQLPDFDSNETPIGLHGPECSIGKCRACNVSNRFPDY